MGTILGSANKENTRYTIFENNQVLTADQLNDLFNYLRVQKRLTRARAIGVGIAGGLQIGVTADSKVVVSKGVALTTDGDLLNLDNDTAYTHFKAYEDDVAHYHYFKTTDNTVLPLFELVTKEREGDEVNRLSDFDTITNTKLKDHIGVLYLEDHLHDPDVCTGTDCDNKGIENIRKLKVLLIHKENVEQLVSTIPQTNKAYFELQDIHVPRVKLKNSISKFDDLNGAFKTPLSIKNEIKEKLAKAYDVCRGLVEDDFNQTDPTVEWNDLLDAHFANGNTIYAQYVYDFARDLATAYNELRGYLFGNNAITCPPVELFPKHVMLGQLEMAAITRPILHVNTNQPSVAEDNRLLSITRSIRFNISHLIRRFNPVVVTQNFRHHFYPSPAISNGDEHIEKIRFAFTRIDSLIKNFKIQKAEDLQSVINIKITPSHFEDKPLGKRSIPFYYSFNRNKAVNAYWDFDANIRQKENDIFYFFAHNYTNSNFVNSPLDFDVLPYSFFRIEGHIGFKYTEVERVLNAIIDENNLPINLITVQVEKDIKTIPKRDWFFPHLHIYDRFIRNSFVDHLQQADLINPTLKQETAGEEEANGVSLSIDNFNNAKAKVLNNNVTSNADFDLSKFRADVSDVIKATTEIKAQTNKFAFSNTAIPHDFIINTDVIHKTDLLADLLKDQIQKKKEELMLGNFMKNNPGLEHAGGVLRGGTFVLVYTSNDDKVVADFMLPYSSVDKDIVKEPPIVKPFPLPEKPRVELPKLFEKVPPYKSFFNQKIAFVDNQFKAMDNQLKVTGERVDKKLTDFDETKKLFDQKLNFIDDKAKDVEARLNQKVADMDATKKILDNKVEFFDNKIKEVDQLYVGKLNEFDKKLDYHGKIFENITRLPNQKNTLDQRGIVVNGTDLTREVDELKRLKTEVATLQPGTPERQQKEAQLATVTNTVVSTLNAPNVTIAKEHENDIKILMFDVQEGLELIQNPNLRPIVTANVNNAVRNIRTRLR